MFVLLHIIFLFGLSDCFVAIFRRKGCEIRLSDLNSNSPLLVNDLWDDVLYPDRFGSISLRESDEIELSCPGSHVMGELEDPIRITCKEFKAMDFECDSRLTSSVRVTKKKCWGWGKGRIIEIGFQIGVDGWLPLMTICFDNVAKNTLYSHYNLSRFINYRQRGGNRPPWQEGNFYNLGVKLNTIYSKVVQRVTINRQLGLEDEDFKYVKETGTYGISTLPHEYTGRQVKLHLFINNGKKALPIPELFWKVAYDRLNKAGIAVLGVNNPFQRKVTGSIICEDIADKLSWLSFNRFNVTSGYIYACTIDDFRESVPALPKFTVNKILD